MNDNREQGHRLMADPRGYLKKSLVYVSFFLVSAIVLSLHLYSSFARAGPIQLAEEILFYSGYVIVGSGVGLFLLAILKYNEATHLWNAARHGWLAPSLLALALWILGGIQNILNGWPPATVANNVLAMGLAASPGIIVFLVSRHLENRLPVRQISDQG